MTEELKIKVTADTSDFKKGMEDVEKKLDKTTDKTEQSQSKWGKLTEQISAISPTFSKASDTWKQSSEKIDASFGSSSAAAGLFKLGVVGALAAIAVKAAQVAWQFANDTAKMFDPQGYSKASGAMQKSIKQLKTTIGSFTAPLVNGIMTVVSKIVDGITWVLKLIRQGVAVLWGIIKTVLQPVIEGVQQIVRWIQQGINALAGFLGFGDVFKSSSESAQDTADSMGEVVEATSAGLASFDKLNTLDMSNAGDAETAEDLNNAIAEAESLGEGIGKKIQDFFANLDLGKMIDDLGQKLSELWDSFVGWAEEAWDSVCEKAGEIWDSICEKAEEIWNAICEFAGEIWNAILETATAIWDAILAVATAIWEGIKLVAETVWAAINAVATAVWTAIQTAATVVWNVINGVAMTVWNTIKAVATTVWNAIQVIATTVWTVISTPILALWNTFKTVGEACWNALQSIGEAFNRVVINPIKNAVQWCMEKIEWVLDMIDSAKNFLGGIGDGIGNAVGGVVNGVKGLLGFADGAVVQPNSPFPVIVGDNTREPEVISPLSTMRQAMMEAIAASGGSTGASSGTMELTINLDGKKLARMLYDNIQTEGIRRGSSI